MLIALSIVLLAIGLYAYIKALIILNDVEQLIDDLKDHNLF